MPDSWKWIQTAEQEELKISRSKIEIRRNFYINWITKKWNGLSQEIINSKIVDTFKRAKDQEKGLLEDATQRAASSQL